MPQTYQRKTQDKYTRENLEQALSDIQQKKLSVKNAAAQYHMPARTLFHRLAGNRCGARRGGKTILTKEEESHLVTTILLFQKWQCPISPSVVIGLAKPYMLQLGKSLVPRSTLRVWFYGFMRRWSEEIKLGKTVKLEKVRSEACRKDTVGKRYFFHFTTTAYNSPKIIVKSCFRTLV